MLAPTMSLTPKMPPNDSQALIDNVHALNGTIKSDGSLAKPAQRARQNAYHLDDWELPLTRKNKKRQRSSPADLVAGPEGWDKHSTSLIFLLIVHMVGELQRRCCNIKVGRKIN